jgi:D-glycero-D-manno-heptose 1,7-bisphosphate phosphatase
MLYLFDVDGTLIRSFMREGDAEHDYDDVEMLEGRWDVLLAVAKQEGSRFGLVTNQAGVAMGYQTPEQVRAKLGRVLTELHFFFARPFSVHCCMHHPKAKLADWHQDPCPRRKPGPGMIFEAMEAHGVFTTETFYIGDMDSDREAAAAAGVRYIDEASFFSAGVSA